MIFFGMMNIYKFDIGSYFNTAILLQGAYLVMLEHICQTITEI